MGEPAIPTPAKRKATHELAAAIVEAVTNDERWPRAAQFDHVVRSRDRFESLVFQLAQEIALQNEDVSNALAELQGSQGELDEMKRDRTAFAASTVVAQKESDQ